MTAKVNNRSLIRRLAFRVFKAGRKMNFVVIFSIVLTCILFTALSSIGGSLINGAQQEAMRQVGTDRMAGFKYVLPEDYEKVKADRAARDVVYRIIVGRAVNEDLKNIFVEVCCAGDENAAKSAFCDPTAGRLPESFDEAAISTLVLDELGLPCELGITVPITLDVDGEITEHRFTLCGYWQGEKVAMAQECWVSRAFADEYAPTPSESFYTQKYPGYAGYYDLDLNFSNSWDIEGKTEALVKRLYGDSDNVPSVGVNWAYTTGNVDGGMLAGGIALLLLIFAAGYLIIYNIFYINISVNIRSYGLLKTIGTTSRQIKRMVRVQAALYCAIGIPLGLVVGVILSRVLMKSIMSILNIYSAASYTVSVKLLVLICLVSAAFTFVTVMVSCRKPCRIAGNVSPIEALRYNETDIHTKKKDKKTGRITPLGVAQSNMSRSRKKTAVVVLSLTLSMILVNTLFTVLRGVDMDKFISEQIIGDFVIMQNQNSRYDEDTFQKITAEQIEYLQHIDGAAELEAVYFEWGSLTLTDKPLERLKTLCGKYAEKDKYGDLAEAFGGEIKTDIYGVPIGLLDTFEPREGRLDEEKFKSGKYALAVTGYLGAEIEDGEDNFYEIGDTLTLTAIDGQTKSYEVMARCSIPYALGRQSYEILGGQVIIPESEYFQLTDNRNAISVMMNAEENRFDEVDTQIRYLTDSESSQLMLKSKQTYLEEFGDLIKMIKLVGGTLSIILALIGILNFANAVITGIISRRRELAMMNAVGMTGRQLSSMLTWEGVHYALLTTFCSLLLGALLSITAVRAVTGDMFFFTYRFTVAPIIICVPVLIALSAAIPFMAYRIICKESIVDRLREN